MVTVAATLSSARRKSVRYVRTGTSSSTFPCSTMRMIAVAVNVFPIEPIWNRVSGVTSSGFSMLVTPSPAVSSSPPETTAIATPGTECASIASCAAWTTSAKRLTPRLCQSGAAKLGVRVLKLMGRRPRAAEEDEDADDPGADARRPLVDAVTIRHPLEPGVDICASEPQRPPEGLVDPPTGRFDDLNLDRDTPRRQRRDRLVG